MSLPRKPSSQAAAGKLIDSGRRHHITAPPGFTPHHQGRPASNYYRVRLLADEPRPGKSFHSLLAAIPGFLAHPLPREYMLIPIEERVQRRCFATGRNLACLA
jgi:hypothetical protein